MLRPRLPQLQRQDMCSITHEESCRDERWECPRHVLGEGSVSEDIDPLGRHLRQHSLLLLIEKAKLAVCKQTLCHVESALAPNNLAGAPVLADSPDRGWSSVRPQRDRFVRFAFGQFCRRCENRVRPWQGVRSWLVALGLECDPALAQHGSGGERDIDLCDLVGSQRPDFTRLCIGEQSDDLEHLRAGSQAEFKLTPLAASCLPARMTS